MLSKMHFAEELASTGNRVFFVNPPTVDLLTYNKNTLPSNLTIVCLKPIKGRRVLINKFFGLYSILSKSYVRRIKKIVGSPIDQVWCFNPHIVTDLRLFGANDTLLFLYDFYRSRYLPKIADTADGIVSVSGIILDYYKNTKPPKLLLQHGLGKPFILQAKRILSTHGYRVQTLRRKMKVGYSGNLLITGLDTLSLKKILKSYSEIEFHFWGTYKEEDSNVKGDGAGEEEIKFVNFLFGQKNVFLHGIKTPEVLSAEIQEMDAFIISYDGEKGISKSSNSHKIMELLSTGKVIISSPISNYEGTGYFPMSDEKVNLVELFDQVIKNLEVYNQPSLQRKRIEFALDNTYSRQIERIEEWIKNIKEGVS